MLAQSAKYLDLVVKGGKLSFPLVGEVEILGLRNARTLIDTSLRGLPEDAPERPALQQVSRFARLAADNLDLSKPILNSIGQPVRVKQTVVERLQDAAGPVRGLGRGDAVADARHRAAGRRAAGAGARGGRLRAPAPAALGQRAAGREDRARRGRGARGHAAAARGHPRSSSRSSFQPLALAAGRAGLRRARDGARRAGARGARRLAAGGAARAAARLPGADPVRRGRARTLFDALNIVSGAFPFKPTLRALDGDAPGLRAPGRAGRRPTAPSRAWRCAGSKLARDGLSRHPPAPPASDRRAARPRPRDRVVRIPSRVPDVRGGDRPQAHADRRAARDRPPLDRRRRRGGRDRALARHPGRAAVRPAGEQGRRGLGRVGRGGRDPARHAGDQGPLPRPAGLHRPLPVRVHLARPLRRAARGRRRRQRPDARAARPHRGLAGRGGRGRRRAQRHDGRPRGRAARRARRARA